MRGSIEEEQHLLKEGSDEHRADTQGQDGVHNLFWSLRCAYDCLTLSRIRGSFRDLVREPQCWTTSSLLHYPDVRSNWPCSVIKLKCLVRVVPLISVFRGGSIRDIGVPDSFDGSINPLFNHHYLREPHDCRQLAPYI